MKNTYSFLVALIIGVFLLTSGNVMGQNMLVNPGFETGFGAHWVAGGTDPINIDSMTVHTGKYAAHGNVEQYIDLQKDTNYVLTCYAYNTTPSINTWVGIRDVTPGGVLVQNFLVDSAGYQFVKIEFAAPSTGSHRFWCWGQNGSDYYSDSWILLKEGTNLTSIDLPKTDKIEILNQSNQVMVNIEDFRLKATINIYDLTGKMIHSKVTTNAKTTLSSSAFGQSGTYFVQVKTDKGFYAKQVRILHD